MLIKEDFHWKEALCTGFSIFIGFGLVIYGFQDASAGSPNQAGAEWLIGAALIVVSIASFYITNGWRSANDLPVGQKIIAYLPVVATGLLFIALLVIFVIGKMVITDSSK